jgi:chemotaxis protein CheD
MTAMEHQDCRVHVIQGQHYVTDDPGVMLTTILGSCVAACMSDPKARVGGMNHFLLPDSDEQTKCSGAERFGAHLMELLVNGLMQRGARRDRMQARLFGGANVLLGLTNIGAENASFAEHYLQNEGIALIGGSLRGERARRIQYWPVSGRARQMYVSAEDAMAQLPKRAPAVRASSGDIELF